MIAWLALGALAQDPASEVRRQYREVELVDGRVLMAEVLATRADGMVVAVPQGEIVLSYEVLLDMRPVDAAAYASQPPWVSVVAVPAEHRAQITALLDAFPSLVVWTADGTIGEPAGPVDLGEAEQTAIRGCGTSAACVRGAFGQGAGRTWVVTVSPEGGGFVVEGALSGTDTLIRVPVAYPTDAVVWTALHQA
ncbi:MAG: hypothetical protein H0V89_05065, partial [Deltaproteobacteria bacterium]|nr:hypothetical protein [Deltaproteobacteria bacterium]